jgi:hypothetical protein
MNERFKEPVLYVENVDECDVNTTGFPTSAEEYLKRVM